MKKKYDVCLWIYQFEKRENTFEDLKIIFESSPFEDKVQLCNLILEFIKKSNFKPLNKENIDYIREMLTQEDFGRNYVDNEYAKNSKYFKNHIIYGKDA